MSLRRLALCAPILFLLTGCGVSPTGVSPTVRPTAATTGLTGVIKGGQQPVGGATISFYAVGTSGDGSPSTSLLTQPVTSNNQGVFSITGLYTCSPTTELVYIVATGGNPGLGPGINNPNIAEMAALGPCNTITTSTVVQVNEVTTVAAVAALAPYMSSYRAIGSGTYDAANLAAAFNLANEYASLTTGYSPGSVPSGYTINTPVIYTLANIIASCINSAGGAAGDNSLCGQLFTLATPPNAIAPPADTIQALLNIIDNPTTLSTPSLFNLQFTAPPYPSTLTSAPATYALAPVPTGGSLQFSSTNYTFPQTAVAFTSAIQTITLTNNGAGIITFQPFTLSGSSAPEFTQVSDCVTLAPGANCQVQLTATPAAAGQRTATLAVPNTATTSPQAITLNVTGGAPAATGITVSPTSLNYTVGYTVQDLTLTNNGLTPLTLRSLPLSASSYFSIESNNCGTTIAPQTSCTISVMSNQGAQLNPPTVTSVLTIDDDAAAGAQTVALASANTASLTTNPSLLFNPSPQSYTTYTQVGATYIRTLEYLSYGLSTFDGPITGANAGDFFGENGNANPSTFPTAGCSVTSYITQSATYGACNFNVEFAPTAAGTRTAQITPPGTSAYYPLTALAVGGTSANFYVVRNNPVLVDLGVGPLTPEAGIDISLNVASDTASGTGSINIVNFGGPTLNLTSFPIFAPDAAQFSATGNCSAVAPGSYCTVTLSFHGAVTTVSGHPATLVLQDTTSGYSQTVPLFPYFEFVATPNSVNFGSVADGTTSQTQTISFDDPYTASSPLNADPVTVSVPVPFTASTPTCSNSTYSCTVSVGFNPTSPGAFTGFVSITDTTTGATTAAAYLTGTGTGPAGTPAISLTATAENFGSQSIGTSTAAPAITLSNPGTAPLTLTLSLAGAVNNNFTLADNCPASLAAGASCAINLTFAPTTSGTQNASLQIVNGASTSPLTVPLTGSAH